MKTQIQDNPVTNGPLWNMIISMNKAIDDDKCEEQAVIYAALSYLRWGAPSRAVEVLENRLQQLNSTHTFHQLNNGN